MPKRNKRRIFGRSNKNKSTKLNQNASSADQRQQESDSDENANESESPLVEHESASSMGQLESSSSTEVNADAVSATPRREETEHQPKATITLKVIQFIGEHPKAARDDESVSVRRHGAPGGVVDSAEINEIENADRVRDDKSVSGTITGPTTLHNESEGFGDVPELDHNEANEASGSHEHQSERFDDNYRVESPKQMCIASISHVQQRTKRHAMLIQEISESSSSEEVKQFLDTEAKALEDVAAPSPKSYRVDSPESSDENNNLAQHDEPLAQEISAISESSSTESVKNEILASISRQPPAQQQQSHETRPALKIINIKELPSEDGNKVTNASSSSSSSKTITQFECRTEKKLNKAEEAILEALYGNKSLLQIPNQPLDVISEEGSECGSDIDRQPPKRSNASAISGELDDDGDDAFLPLSTSQLSAKPPSARHRNQVQRVAEQPLLLNAKIIETETNIPESCKSWETSPGDSELQAELVYLTSTSSSATDLSERGDFTDTDDVEDTSDDTETNSMLDNISVPSLEFEHDRPLEMRYLHPTPTEYYQEIAEQKLADILEEEEDSSPRSLDIVECQQQIANVNKELHDLSDEHERQSEEKDEKTREDVHDTVCDNDDKRVISDDDKARDDLSCRVTPTTPTLLLKRKYSSDSTSSSNNSQCTIIRHLASTAVDPLRDLCVESLMKSGFTLDTANKGMERRITVHKRLNSSSRNAPQLPIINQLELRYECDNSDDLEGRDNAKVITIIQVPPDMNCPTKASTDKTNWLGLQSTQIPNLLVALSPMQMSHVMKSPDSNTNADVLLDMHKKFVERRAYHEADEIENGGQRAADQFAQADQLEDGYFGDRENSVENIIETSSKVNEVGGISNCDSRREEHENISARTSCHENSRGAVKSAEVDIKMNSIRNFIAREEFFRSTFDASRDEGFVAESFEAKKSELESELKQLDEERTELEEELKNLRSMQHFKREEFLFNEQKLQDKIQKNFEAFECRNSTAKYANDDFNEFVYSNERLQQELYNEWQDKVLERKERKLQKTIKITSITEAIRHDENLKSLPLENEFMSKLKERQKRLSLPTEAELNSSTESLHHQNEKSKLKVAAKDDDTNIPPHLYEFIKYYEEEAKQGKNSADESGESNKSLAQPLLFGLIGVSMCLCGFYIGKHFITQRPKLF